jgi:hypothetical protein
MRELVGAGNSSADIRLQLGKEHLPRTRHELGAIRKPSIISLTTRKHFLCTTAQSLVAISFRILYL